MHLVRQVPGHFSPQKYNDKSNEHLLRVLDAQENQLFFLSKERHERKWCDVTHLSARTNLLWYSPYS